MFSKGSESRTKFLLSASQIYRHEHVRVASAFLILAISTAIPSQLLVPASLCLFIMVPIIEQWLQLAGWTDLAVASLLMSSLGMDRVCGMPGNQCHHFSTACAALTECCSRMGRDILGLVVLRMFLGKTADQQEKKRLWRDLPPDPRNINSS